MTRRTVVVDRLVTLVLALALLAAGVGAVGWWAGYGGLPSTADLGAVSDTTASAWWPMVSLVGGVVLVLLGLRLLVVQLKRPGVPRLLLGGSDPRGRLEVASDGLADAAADAFADTVGVHRARGRVLRRRGQLVLRVTASIDRDADLYRLARHADRVAIDLGHAIGREDLRCSVELRLVGPVSRLAR